MRSTEKEIQFIKDSYEDLMDLVEHQLIELYSQMDNVLSGEGGCCSLSADERVAQLDHLVGRMAPKIYQLEALENDMKAEIELEKNFTRKVKDEPQEVEKFDDDDDNYYPSIDDPTFIEIDVKKLLEEHREEE